MKKLHVFCMFLIFSTLSSQAFAGDEYPTTGIVYNTKEDSSIIYDCTKVQNGTLECEFVQTAVRKKTKAADLKKKLEEARKELPNALKELSSEKSCDWMSASLAVLEGKNTAEKAAADAPPGVISNRTQFIKAMKEMPQSKKQELIASLSPLDEFCKTKTEESYLKVIKFEHDKEMRTCAVSSNPFKQIFKWVEDYSGKGAWVVNANPEGPCGIVQLTKFEADHTNSKLIFWRYIAKKAITNPKGELMLPGLSCGDLDQNEYLYDWKNDRDNKLGCEYIEFSPI